MIAAVLSGIAVVLSSGAVLAQPATDLGKAEYYSKCAACHGLSGKGEGSFGEVLKVNMPDLTLIAEAQRRRLSGRPRQDGDRWPRHAKGARHERDADLGHALQRRGPTAA